MTALKPSETWKITPLQPDEERKFLRRQVASPVCCHPDCDKPTESVHHAWPQGFIQSSSYVVRVEGQEKPVIHAIGLCGSGTTGHHGDLEDHRAWLKYEDGVWNWYTRFVDDEWELLEDEWDLVGPLDPQPGELTHKKKGRPKKAEREAKPKNSWTINLPKKVKDDGEDGIALLKDMIEQAREKIGRPEWSGPYYTLIEVLAVFLRDAHKEIK